MRVSAISWTRYRSFKEYQRIEIAPITIIIGRNGSGKSVISRLPLLIASGLSPDAVDHLDLDAGGIIHASGYQDLVNSRGRLPFTLGAEISDNGEKFEFETSLRYVTEVRNLVVESFSLRFNGEIIFGAELSDESQLTENAPYYKINSNYEINDEKIHFNGILPNVSFLDGEIRTILERSITAIRSAFPMPSYLGPFRAEASFSNRAPGRRVRSLGPKGERAIELLADDKVRYGGELIRSVSEWFTSALGQSVSIDIHEDRTRLIVSDRKSGIDVSLSDTGVGFSQVLPIVVQHYAFRMSRLPSSNLIVEQPELHLHPAAHGSVMDLMLQTVNGSNSSRAPNCIIETHSEQIIMRLRRRIAEGFDCRKVVLLSLNHKDSSESDSEEVALKSIRFDNNGDPDAWPAGVFEEALDDLTALRKAARENDQ